MVSEIPGPISEIDDLVAMPIKREACRRLAVHCLRIISTAALLGECNELLFARGLTADLIHNVNALRAYVIALDR